MSDDAPFVPIGVHRNKPLIRHHLEMAHLNSDGITGAFLQLFGAPTHQKCTQPIEHPIQTRCEIL